MMTPTALPTSSAHSLAAIFVALYVGSIYVSRKARLSFSTTRVNLEYGYSRLKESSERWRDDPDVIRARLVAVSMATLLCCAIVHAVVNLGNANVSWTTLKLTFHHLGFTSTNLLSHLITPLLFLGPLYGQFLVEALPGQRNWSFRENVVSFCFSLVGTRNYIVAPITEEILFRACVLNVYRLARASRTRMVFLSPLLFGTAHIHHAWDTYNRYGRSSAAMKRAVISTVFQFAYTSVFGFLCSYLFLRTGSVFPPITAHVFCNIMGLPQPGHDISQRPDRKLAVVVAYLVGIIGFVYVLPRWTLTEGSQNWN